MSTKSSSWPVAYMEKPLTSRKAYARLVMSCTTIWAKTIPNYSPKTISSCRWRSIPMLSGCRLRGYDARPIFALQSVCPVMPTKSLVPHDCTCTCLTGGTNWLWGCLGWLCRLNKRCIWLRAGLYFRCLGFALHQQLWLGHHVTRFHTALIWLLYCHRWVLECG